MNCIQVAQKGRNRDVDVLRHTILEQKSTYCVRRLLRDLKEIDENDIPTVGVAARPLEKDILTWHANLRGPEGTPYHGAVFHLSMAFPDNYPHSPPSVTLLTPLPEHPNVFDGGSRLCLDMLENSSSKGLYEGWTSGYSVLSILLQLQSFLFELPHDSKDKEGLIRKRVQAANQFSCSHPGCRHKGPIQAWPEFNKKETLLDAFVMCKSEEQRMRDEICCFHSRLRAEECALGVGISMTRVPRTGELRSVESTLDLLSLRAYIKDSVRASLSKAKFTHWFPLFLGHEQSGERFLFLARHAISMVCENSTRKFDPTMILQVLPKLIVTLVVQMMDLQTHTSLKALRMFLYLQRAFLLLLESHPDQLQALNARIASFKADEDKRTKDHCSSMGDLLAFCLVSPDFKISDILLEYLDESLDRQVLWMLRDVPELGELPPLEDETGGKASNIEKKSIETSSSKAEAQMDAKRDEVAFKTNITSNHVLLFFCMVERRLFSPDRLGELSDSLDKNFGQLPEKVEAELQRECENIHNVKSFTSFFAELGLPPMSKPQLTARLRQAVRNSLRKKYHGDDDAVNILPEPNVMLGEYSSRFPGFRDFLSSDKVFDPIDPNHPRYREAVIARLPWVSDLEESGLSPAEVVTRHERDILRPQTSNRREKGREDNLEVVRREELEGETASILEKSKGDEIYSHLTWRGLLVKLELEAQLKALPVNPDFMSLYDTLDKVGGEVESLMVPVVERGSLKSGQYWLMVLLSRLPRLRKLILFKPWESSGALGLEGLKYLTKGLTNYKEKGGRLEQLVVSRVALGNSTHMEEKFSQCLRTVGEELKVLRMNDLTMTKGMATAVAKMLSENKKMVELDLRRAGLSTVVVKEVADGLMRAKQLEVIKLAGNPSMDYGVNYILYNLAFSPRISFIDISDTVVNQRQDETAEALYKLLKISGSLETLALNRTAIMHSLTIDFWRALGENVTLRHLFIDSTGQGLNAVATLGKFVGLNAFKKGSLSLLSLRNCFRNSSNFGSFVDSMSVSEADHEREYGERSEADKMSGTQIERHFHCGLGSLFISGGRLTSNFNLQSWLKYSPDKRPHQSLVTLCTKGKLHRLELSSSQLNKSDADLIGLCLGHQACTLTALNISGNQLRKEGAKALAGELDHNSTLLALDLSNNKIGVSGTQAMAGVLGSKNSSLRYLNLSNNNSDVDGARSLKVALASNSTLRHLDVGYNRLRMKGVSALAEGLFSNPNSALCSLALRNNFLTDDAFLSFVKSFLSAKSSSLRSVFVKRNLFSELGLTRMRAMLTSHTHENKEEEKKETKGSGLGSGLGVDALEKVRLLENERLERTIWVSPIPSHIHEARVKKFFEEKKCGLVVGVRIRESGKVEGKPALNRYAFVEFAHPTSVLRGLRLASKKKSTIDGNRVRIYKAGSRTVTHVRPKKAKNLKAVKVARFGGARVNLRKKKH